MRHVLGFEMMLADRAADHVLTVPVLPRRARQIETAARRPGDRRRHDEADDQSEERRQRLQGGSEHAGERRDPGGGRRQHGADPDRIDVVEVRALELDPRRA